jgi:hypothetical protein
MWVCELLPWTASMVDEMCFIRSMHTEAINHEPAITYMQTGNQITGRPCLGSWLSYGLGSLNDDLPTFVVLVARLDQHRAGAGDRRPALVEWLSAPVNTQASASAPQATRSSTSTTHPESPVTSAAQRSTAAGTQRTHL